MKITFISIIKICLIAVFFFGCQKEEDLPVFKSPEGNLKLKRVLRYNSLNLDEPYQIAEEYEYDEKGRISMISAPYESDDSIKYKLFYNVYEYNSEGMLAKITCYNRNIYSETGYLNLRNYIYTYSAKGQIEKEYIEFPVISSFEYSLYKYNNNRLDRVEKYKTDTDELYSQVLFTYDHSGKLIKEQTVFENNPDYLFYTNHIYSDIGLLIKSDVYAGNESDLTFLKEIIRTYDGNYNMTIMETNELSIYSSQKSFVLRYEYF